MTARSSRRRRMRHRAAWPLALLAALAAGGSPAAAAEGSCAASLTERVQKRYDRIRDLRARFEQRTDRASLGGAPADALVASGEVVFAKPGRMRWRYEAPEPSLVVSDGKTLWIFDEKAREVQKLALGEGFVSAAGVQFLLGDGKLAAEFEIAARGCDAELATLLLDPKRETHYERIELRVDRESGAVVETVVVDLFGNRTTVAFRDVRENAGAASDLFRFDPPAGARVLELPSEP